MMILNYFIAFLNLRLNTLDASVESLAADEHSGSVDFWFLIAA